MAAPQNIALHVVVNAGAPQVSPPTVAFSDSIVLQLDSASGVQSAKYRITEYPEGFACPAGWTDLNGIYMVTRQNGAPAPAFALPASTYWGKYFFDVEVNERRRDGTIADDLFAENALQIPSTTGIEDVGYRESNQFDSKRQWVGAIKALLRHYDAAPVGSDPDAIHDNVAGEIAAIALKASPVSGDLLVIEDSADSNNKKRVTVGSLPGGGTSSPLTTKGDLYTYDTDNARLPVGADNSVVTAASAQDTGLAYVAPSALVYSASPSNYTPDSSTIGGHFIGIDAALAGIGAAHALGGAEHTADTLANLNTKVSDATLVSQTYVDGADDSHQAAAEATAEAYTDSAISTHEGAADPHSPYSLAPGAVSDNRLVRFDGTTGRATQQSAATESDAGAVSGWASVQATAAPTVDAHLTRKDYVDTPPTTQTIVASATTSDGDAASVTALSFTPRGGRWPDVYWQGVWGEVGDLTAPFYFSGDSGTTARANGAVVSGDTLHLNGSVAGFELAAGESISIRSV